MKSLLYIVIIFQKKIKVKKIFIFKKLSMLGDVVWSSDNQKISSRVCIKIYFKPLSPLSSFSPLSPLFPPLSPVSPFSSLSSLSSLLSIPTLSSLSLLSPLSPLCPLSPLSLLSLSVSATEFIPRFDRNNLVIYS